MIVLSFVFCSFCTEQVDIHLGYGLLFGMLVYMTIFKFVHVYTFFRKERCEKMELILPSPARHS